jgi:hypothetical protein
MIRADHQSIWFADTVERDQQQTARFTMLEVPRLKSNKIQDAEQAETLQPLSAALFTCSFVITTSTP